MLSPMLLGHISKSDAILLDPTAPNVGGVPQSHNFFHPHFSNHANVSGISDTFNIGVKPFASMVEAE
jgi:hypothetical protein